MKNVIDCDGVFEILTQAPFPTGSGNDDDVEAHLRVCHDCRCLAEALRPAVGLFHESLANEESLPRYGGRLAEIGQLAEIGPRVGWGRTSHFGAMLVAGLAGCLLTWLSYAGGYRGDDNSPGRLHPSVSAVPDTDGFSTLCALRLPNSCFKSDGRRTTPLLVAEAAAKPLVNMDDLAFSCCTQCHRSGGTGSASARALGALNVACAACHRPPAMSTAIDLSLRWFTLVKNVG